MRMKAENKIASALLPKTLHLFFRADLAKVDAKGDLTEGFCLRKAKHHLAALAAFFRCRDFPASS
jgi:hypothetical protein